MRSCFGPPETEIVIDGRIWVTADPLPPDQVERARERLAELGYLKLGARVRVRVVSLDVRDPVPERFFNFDLRAVPLDR